MRQLWPIPKQSRRLNRTPSFKTYTFFAPAGGVGDWHISEAKTLAEDKALFDMCSQQGESELDHPLDRVQAGASTQRVAARELLLRHRRQISASARRQRCRFKQRLRARSTPQLDSLNVERALSGVGRLWKIGRAIEDLFESQNDTNASIKMIGDRLKAVEDRMTYLEANQSQGITQAGAAASAVSTAVAGGILCETVTRLTRLAFRPT